MPLFPYPKVRHSNYTPSKIELLCVIGGHFPVVTHYPVAYVRSLVLVCIYNIVSLSLPYSSKTSKHNIAPPEPSSASIIIGLSDSVLPTPLR